jgi:hypothetical protein
MLLLLLPQILLPLPLSGAADLLQLAFNCSYPGIADVAFERIPAQLDAPAARKLLLTAAVRHDGEVARQLVRVPTVRQHLDAPTLSTVLKVLLPRASEQASSRHGSAMRHLLHEQQAVAQQMGRDAVVEVLKVALASRASQCAWRLSQLPIVQQLEVDGMLELLSAAVDALDSYGAGMVSSPPAARELATEDVVQRLQAVAEACDIRMVCVLLHLPAAQQLSDGDVMPVLRAAENSGDDSVWHMCSLLMC